LLISWVCLYLGVLAHIYDTDNTVPFVNKHHSC